MNSQFKKIAEYLLIAIVAIWLVSVVERFLNRQSSDQMEIVRYEQEKAQMQREVKHLEEKIHDYEIKILETHISVDTMSHDELDSLFTALTR